MRILKIGFVLTLLATLTAHGQSKYRVGLCPGSAKNYQILATNVNRLNTLRDHSHDDDSLKKYLNDWVKRENLKRYQVAIHFPDNKVRFWQSSAGEKGSFFNISSIGTAAARGDLATNTKPGDNQRCFFQDTTVVLDTLHIRLGDFSPDTPFTLVINQKKYSLPLNAKRTEFLLYAGLLPDSPTGRYLSASITIDKETNPVILYFLSADNRAQLLRSLRDWVAVDPPNCTELPDQLVAHLTSNWGGKQCVSPALYYSAQRQAIRYLLRTEHIACIP